MTDAPKFFTTRTISDIASGWKGAWFVTKKDLAAYALTLLDELSRNLDEIRALGSDKHALECALQSERERAERAERERDEAIAHDRQPYPTVWAYEQACKVLEKTKKERDEVEAIIDSWGCPKYRRICLICGGKEPCMKESDLKPEDPGIPCTFDMTFKDMIDTIHRLERQLRDKSRENK